MIWPREGIIRTPIDAVATVATAALAVLLPVWIVKKQDQSPARVPVELRAK